MQAVLTLQVVTPQQLLGWYLCAAWYTSLLTCCLLTHAFARSDLFVLRLRLMPSLMLRRRCTVKPHMNRRWSSNRSAAAALPVSAGQCQPVSIAESTSSNNDSKEVPHWQASLACRSCVCRWSSYRESANKRAHSAAVQHLQTSRAQCNDRRGMQSQHVCSHFANNSAADPPMDSPCLPQA